MDRTHLRGRPRPEPARIRGAAGGDDGVRHGGPHRLRLAGRRDGLCGDYDTSFSNGGFSGVENLLVLGLLYELAGRRQ